MGVLIVEFGATAVYWLSAKETLCVRLTTRKSERDSRDIQPDHLPRTCVVEWLSCLPRTPQSDTLSLSLFWLVGVYW